MAPVAVIRAECSWADNQRAAREHDDYSRMLPVRSVLHAPSLRMEAKNSNGAEEAGNWWLKPRTEHPPGPVFMKVGGLSKARNTVQDASTTALSKGKLGASLVSAGWVWHTVEACSNMA